ncbi:hypothetical protein FRC08_008589, partial [Ceratobasidium sp. 394]
WFVQRSGDGYRFKNCQHENFLAVANTDPHSLVYASRFPTTWVLLKVNDGYLIQYAGNNRVLDLHWGWGNNGNEIHIWPAVGENANKIWKFERLSDDAGEELPASFRERADRLTQDLDTQTQNLARKDEKIALLEQELANLRREAEEENSPKLAKLMDDLAQKDVVIRQLRQEVKEKDEALTRAGKENEEMSHLRKQQVQLQNELSQQQAETASLQGKMDRVEYLMARMSKSYDEV